jgi:hypothetical protein
MDDVIVGGVSTSTSMTNSLAACVCVCACGAGFGLDVISDVQGGGQNKKSVLPSFHMEASEILSFLQLPPGTRGHGASCRPGLPS